MIKMKPIAKASNNRSEIKDDYWGKTITEITLDDHLHEDALEGIELFSHLEIIFYFHLVDESKIISGARHPRNDISLPKMGILAQRGKNRPNRLGLTTVKLLKRDGRKLFVEGLDCINGTPILDIKPVMKSFLPKETVREPKWTDEIMKDYWK
ncbi:SAM-dependent methyltransferase [Bacillus sp. SG-1]|uniref:SAM-dependent methyltransferase n=1 Tax=Bacillus sp. SG-1 TaxID=161544 RepID=UPI0002F8C37E|nr:SAM-dependent methyltransferase [Bacillus sp. SG-1]